MKLHVKLLLLMGGFAVLVTTAVLAASFLNLKSTLEDIRESGHNFAFKVLREKSRCATQLFRMSLDSLHLRINDAASSDRLFNDAVTLASESTVSEETDSTCVPPVRFNPSYSKHAFLSNSDMFLTGRIVPAPADSSLKVTATIDNAVSRTQDFKPIPSELVNIVADIFLNSKLSSNSLGIIAGKQIWIISFTRNADEHSFIAVRFDSKILEHELAAFPGSAYILFENGNIVNFSSGGQESDIPEELTAKASDLATQATIPGKEKLSFAGVSDDWYMTFNNIGLSLFPSDDFSLVHIQNVKQTMPEMSTGIIQKIENLQIMTVLLALFGLLLLVVPLIFFAKRISEPISKAAAFANDLAEGQFPTRSLPGGDVEEIRVLMKSLNHMRDRLNSAISQLTRSHKRELEARCGAEHFNKLKSTFLHSLSARQNVDFDTALTAIHTLFRHITLNGESNVQHILKNCRDTLTSAIAALEDDTELLSSLADLDGEDRTVKAPLETFKLFRNTAGTILPFAERYGIVLETNYASDIPNTIYADSERLEHIFMIIFESIIRNSQRGNTLNFSCMYKDEKIFFIIEGRSCEVISEIIKYNAAIRESIPELDAYISDNKLSSSMIDIMIGAELFRTLNGTFNVSENRRGDFTLRLELSMDDLTSDSKDLTGTAALHYHAKTVSASPNKEFRRNIKIQRKRTRAFLADTIVNRPASHLAGAAFKIACACSESENSLISLLVSSASGGFSPVCVTPHQILRELGNSHYDILIFGDSTSSETIEMIRTIRKRFPRHSLYIIAVIKNGFPEEPFNEAGADTCITRPLLPNELTEAVRKCHKSED